MNRRERPGGAEPDGYLLLRKRPGISSFDALNAVKRALGTGRVGHSGTLDKFAEGLLVVLVGRSTRLVPWFTGCDKEYLGRISFGNETDTLDPEGEIVDSAPSPNEETLKAAMKRFHGDIMQAPPLYSSVHVNGKRAHELARSGKDVKMAERPITIHSLELLSYDGEFADIFVKCSKGTYIRSLARDIARASGSCAHLIELKRSRVAGFDLSEAVDPSAEGDPDEAIRSAFRPIDERAFSAIGVPIVTIAADKALFVAHGKPFDSSWCGGMLPDADTAIFLEDGRFLAILAREDGRYRYGYVALRPEEV